MNDIQYMLNFTDLTILETSGEFQGIKKIMEGEFPYSEKWTLRSKLSLETYMGYRRIGVSEMEIQLNEKSEVYILEFTTSNGDLFTNPDVEGLANWAEKNGWKPPIPDPVLVRKDVEFWKHFWQMLLINSPYLDYLYGEREHAQEE